MAEHPPVLSVHAVDTRGEEGVLADAVVFRELHCAPVLVTTSVLASDGQRLQALEGLSLALVAQQFESALAGCRLSGARTGILRDARQIALVADLLDEYRVPNLVVAPVVRVGGADVLDRETHEATRGRLYPRARVLVVRAGDLPLIAGRQPGGLDAVQEAAATLRSEGVRAVLVAGVVSRGRVLDVLDDDGRTAVCTAARIHAPRIAGLAGAHAAALAAHLANGEDLVRATAAAQRYVGFRLQRAG